MGLNWLFRVMFDSLGNRNIFQIITSQRKFEEKKSGFVPK